MKKAVVALAAVALLTLGMADVRASQTDIKYLQQTEVRTQFINSESQGDKVEIDVGDLPSKVRNAVNGGDFKDWAIQRAYHLVSKDQYEVEITDGNMTKLLTYTKEGQRVD